MEKVWFKLRQTDYPPEDDDEMGSGKETGPLCLGHFIKDFKHVDLPLNRGEIEKFPAHMKVYLTNSLNFSWGRTVEAETGCELGAGAPIAAAVGVVLKAGVRAIFRHEVHNWEMYDRLDTYIVQPDKVYVAECLEGEVLSKHVEKHASWSMFMVTGVKVARFGEKNMSDFDRKGTGAGFETDVPGIALAKADLNFTRSESQHLGGLHISDFVWAVRLAKVSKGILSKDWSLKSHTRRATFGIEENEEQVDVVRTVAAESPAKFHVIEHEELDEALVILDSEPEQP